MRYIDTTDLPSDPNGSMGNLRRELRKAYNTNRDFPDKLELLSKTLKYVLAHIDQIIEPEPIESDTDTGTEAMAKRTKIKPKKKKGRN